MSHVGISIDLSHPNMGFLKRKIQTKKAEMKEQEKIRNERATRASAATASMASPKESPQSNKAKSQSPAHVSFLDIFRFISKVKDVFDHELRREVLKVTFFSFRTK